MLGPSTVNLLNVITKSIPITEGNHLSNQEEMFCMMIFFSSADCIPVIKKRCFCMSDFLSLKGNLYVMEVMANRQVVKMTCNKHFRGVTS